MSSGTASIVSRCLDAAIDAERSGREAIVEVHLEVAQRLHSDWSRYGAAEFPPPTKPGDRVGWCQQALVIVALEAAAVGQLSLFGGG